MKKSLIIGLTGILLTSLPLNGQIQDKKYVQKKNNSTNYEQEWQGHTQETPYMKYRQEKERQEELKRQGLQKQNSQINTIEKKTIQNKQNPVVYHIIQKGDSFYNLADFYWGTDKEADEIEKLNPGVDPTKLKIGQKIRVK